MVTFTNEKKQCHESLQINWGLKDKLWFDVFIYLLQSIQLNLSCILASLCLVKDSCDLAVLCKNNLRKSVRQTAKWEEMCEITRHDATVMKHVQTLAHPHMHNWRYRMQIERDVPTWPGSVPVSSGLGGVHGTVRFFLLKVPIKLLWLCNSHQQTSRGWSGFAGCFQVPHWARVAPHIRWWQPGMNHPRSLTSITQTRSQLEECVSHCRSSDSSLPAASLPDHSPETHSIKLSYIL